jgi:hypothetical protein
MILKRKQEAAGNGEAAAEGEGAVVAQPGMEGEGEGPLFYPTLLWATRKAKFYRHKPL